MGELGTVGVEPGGPTVEDGCAGVLCVGAVGEAGTSVLPLGATSMPSFGLLDSPQPTLNNASQTAGTVTRLMLLLIICTSTV